MRKSSHSKSSSKDSGKETKASKGKGQEKGEVKIAHVAIIEEPVKRASVPETKVEQPVVPQTNPVQPEENPVRKDSAGRGANQSGTDRTKSLRSEKSRKFVEPYIAQGKRPKFYRDDVDTDPNGNATDDKHENQTEGRA
eukprot:TRINITY_DN921_c0_g1_i5.p1 TRINITY_DN921_c0_g1~~TRINITY_DN921_c0_g1_i5.p1  ORF type:complete len:139 (-),score=29.91 TRINITY_DN921_c0_g1_i5:136-552(-)